MIPGALSIELTETQTGIARKRIDDILGDLICKADRSGCHGL